MVEVCHAGWAEMFRVRSGAEIVVTVDGQVVCSRYITYPGGGVLKVEVAGQYE